jgi:hypothetical protein
MRRPLRYCARPPFVMARLRELDREPPIYAHPKPGSGSSGPPLWEATSAEHDPSADSVPQPAFEFDQRLTG